MAFANQVQVTDNVPLRDAVAELAVAWNLHRVEQRRADEAERRLTRLLKMLEERSDTVDGPDGEPRPNEANSILSEYQGWLDGWIK